MAYVYDYEGNSSLFAYDVDGMSLLSVYDVNGSEIELKKDYSNYSFTELLNKGPVGGDWIQGIAYYDGVIFQLGENKFQTINMSTGDYITDGYVSVNSIGHGNSAQFTDEFYSESDRFPLLYVSTNNQTTNYVRVYRMTDTTATLIKSILLNTSEDGYYPDSCVDSENGYLYTISYLQDNWQTQTDENVLVLTKRDLNDLTDNGNGIYTANLLSRTELNYWEYSTQGCTFYDGYIWMAFGGGSSPNNFYAIDPTTGSKAFTVTIPNTREPEGLAWVLDKTDSPWLLVGQQYHLYQKCVFT